MTKLAIAVRRTRAAVGLMRLIIMITLTIMLMA